MQKTMCFIHVIGLQNETCEKPEGALLKKCLWMNKKLHNEIRSENLNIFNFKKIGNAWASY